jgi:hypothetical protein
MAISTTYFRRLPSRASGYPHYRETLSAAQARHAQPVNHRVLTRYAEGELHRPRARRLIDARFPCFFAPALTPC